MGTEAPHGRILYLNFETMDPDRAAHTHVNGVIGALSRRGWKVELIAEESNRTKGVGFRAQLQRYRRLTMRGLRALDSSDAVYARAHFAIWPIAFVAYWRGIPIFHEINGVPDDIIVTYPTMRRVSAILQWLYRSQFRQATHLFAVTDGLAAYARNLAEHRRVSVAPNGVDEGAFRPSAHPLPEKAPREPFAVFYGDVARWHGLELMLQAVRSPMWPSELRLVIIGRGSAAAPEDLPGDLRRTIVWLDRMPQSNLLPFICNASLGLAPVTDPGGRSSTGVMPLKVLEMMACGLPVVVTDLPGQGDLVRASRCGLVCLPDNSEALAGKVAELYASNDRRNMGLRGREVIESRFTWDVIGSKLDAVIAGSLASTKPIKSRRPKRQ